MSFTRCTHRVISHDFILTPFFQNTEIKLAKLIQQFKRGYEKE